MFCTKCGKELQDGAKFCIGCGAPVGKVPAELRPAKEKKSFDPMKIVSSAAENVAALKTNKKLLIMVGGGLAAILIIIIVIVLIAVNTKKTPLGGAVSKAPKGEYYFDRPLVIGQTVEFGEFEQDGNPANGKEPIKWHVISAENERYLLVCHNVIEALPWDDGTGSGGSGGLSHGSDFLYEDSSLRRWLNNSFDPEAFGEKERKYIIPVSFRDDVITVDKNNQYAKDYAFILSYQEVEWYIPRTVVMNYWKRCAPPTKHALQNGADTVDVHEYLDLWLGFGTDYPENNEDAKREKAMAVFNDDQPDYFDVDCVAGWFVRDTDTSGRNLQVYYTGFNDGFDVEPATTVGGVRPAIYISADACYVAPVEVNKKLGSAGDKLAEYQGKYCGPLGFTAGNYPTITIQQNFIDIDAYMGLPQSEDDDLKFIFNTQQESLTTGRIDTAEFEYTVEGGKDCFTNRNKGVRLVYDPKTEELQWYVSFPKGTRGLSPGKADQWLLYYTLVTEEKFFASREGS